MHKFRLNELYKHMLAELNMIDFMDSDEEIELIPLSKIEYLDKIKGLFLGISLGNELDRDIAIRTSESLIIYQDYNPGDMVNRLLYRLKNINSDNVSDYKLNSSKSKISLFNNMDLGHKISPTIIAPLAAINYGDFYSLKLMTGIQASIINRDYGKIGMYILMSTALAHLMNMHPFSLKNNEDSLEFIDICSNSIRGIKDSIDKMNLNKDFKDLYNILDIDIKDALKEDIDIHMAKEKWGNSVEILDSLTYSFYIYLKTPNDCGSLFKNAFMAKNPHMVVGMVFTLVGAYLGLNNIPGEFMEGLNNFDEIFTLSERLFEISLENPNNNPYRKRSYSGTTLIHEDVVDRLIWEGIKYSNEGQNKKVVAHFEKLICDNPNTKRNHKIKSYIIEAYANLGTNELENEDFKEALKYFKKALAYDLNNPTILCDIAITYLNLDDLNRAEKYVRRSVEISPGYQIGREVLDAIISLKKQI